jgi:hypothetical protein
MAAIIVVFMWLILKSGPDLIDRSERIIDFNNQFIKTVVM